ncbi:hypothetical protein PPYR_13150 [Photinus pyralis]|uniref:Uncharacterized protein n=1 Tax=Photinus pyralis TaxID=7054 RepID=A0A1Y1NEF6_PHOPY|nr:uncharacterized protein LOC116178574 [Photinus pyralis]KAB0793530.1 hypothetical protein PPYR_13150 [Photinus pyralis]
MLRFNGKYKNGIHHLQPKKCENQNIVISEWRLGLCGLIISLIILTSKILYANHESLRSMLFEKRFVTYETIVTDGEVVVRHAWVTALRYSWFWFPIVCGSLATWFTGLMVYIDSSVPGIQPPSPISPSKYKAQSGHMFHLNYVFAVVVGFLVSGYMFIRGFSLEI